MVKSTERRKWSILLAAILLVGAGWGYHAASAPSVAGSEEVFSFDMWCLEMRLYPPMRCDSRFADDVKAYERYRATAERFAEQRAARAKRDQQLQERLDPNTSKPKQGPVGR